MSESGVLKLDQKLSEKISRKTMISFDLSFVLNGNQSRRRKTLKSKPVVFRFKILGVGEALNMLNVSPAEYIPSKRDVVGIPSKRDVVGIKGMS